MNFICALALFAVAAMAQLAVSTDEARSAWRYRRSVALPADGLSLGAFVAVPLPPEIGTRSQGQLQDLRLVDADGADVPFVLDRDEDRQVVFRRTGRLAEAQRAGRRTPVWIVDFGAATAFDRVELTLPGSDFTWQLTLEASDDGTQWREAGPAQWVFDQPWQTGRVRDTALEWTEPIQTRFLAISADDRRADRLRITNAVAVASRAIAGSTWEREASLTLVETVGTTTRYSVDVAEGLPVEQMTIDADDAAFVRAIAVSDRREASGQTVVQRVGGGTLYRLRLSDPAVDVDARTIAIARRQGGSLVVEIENGDNPPLGNPRARVSGRQRRLIAAATTSPLTLYYGNAVTRRAIYDLEQLRGRLAAVGSYPTAEVGEEVENPLYAPPPPLAFVPTRGARLDTSAWRRARRLRIDGGDDLYTMLVAPEDLGMLRRDLGDLRLVDADERQVPYVMQPAAERTRVPLAVSSASPRAGGAQASAYRLVAGLAQRAPGLPIAGLSVTFRETFFTRQASVLVRREQAPTPGGLVEVASTTLTALSRDPGARPSPLIVEFSDIVASELILEIQNGDNAPLALTEAAALVRSARITFKAGAGEYRLLMGQPDARAPSYELSALRREVLSYSAVPLEASAIDPPEDNPDFDPGVADYIAQAPPALLLWGVLGAAVGVLLLLTRRILMGEAKGS